jgi:hypothetical protein
MARLPVVLTVALSLLTAVLADVRRAYAAQPEALEVTLTLDRGAYEPGMPISFTIRVRNLGAQPVTLTFPTSQRFDVVIRRDVEVSRWSQDKVFLQVQGSETWAPGQEVVYSDQWVPMTDIGPHMVSEPPLRPLEPVVYIIHAEITSAGVRPRSPAQLLIVGRPTDLAPGCSVLVSRFPVVAVPMLIAAAVEPRSALESLWRFHAPLNRFEGWSPLPDAPADLRGYLPGEAIVICLRASARFYMPDG